MSEMSYLEKLLDGVEVEWKTLGEVAKYVRGLIYSKSSESADGQGYKVLRANNITLSNNCLNLNDVKVVRFDTKVKSSQKLYKNDILISAASGSREHVGKVAYIESDIDYYFGGFMGVVRCDEKLNPRYLFHVLTSDIFQKYLDEMLNSSTINNLNSAVMGRFKIPLPCPDTPEKSLAIQSEIVRILDKFTALTAELTAELNMRKKQYNYYRDQLLSFKEGEVEWKTLGEIGKWYGGGTPSKNKIEFWENGSIPWISPKDMGRTLVDSSEDYITEEAVLQSSTKLIPANSIAIVVRSSILDKVLPSALIKVPATLNQDMKAVIPHENILVKYIYHMIGSRGSDILRAAKKTGGSVASIDSKKLFSFKIPVPNINEQQRIVEILDKFDTLTNSITEGLPREIELRQKQYEYYRDLLFSFPKPETVSN
ncbi:restriction endonuclease subunit S [Escherichia coli]|nr:restriction endonuclease subunit S [Escherichia coli]